MSLISIISSMGGSIAAPVIPDDPTYFTPLVASTVVDDGWYNGFPFPHQLEDGTIISIYKKSSDHASKGPMMIAKSINGGASWTESQISVGGTPIECAALSMGVLSSGRILISYQDDEIYRTIKWAYSDNGGVSFTASASVHTIVSGIMSHSPIKMIQMPSGKVLMGYYEYNGAGTQTTIAFLESSNNGLTWALGSTISVNNTQATASPFADWKMNEFGVCIVENTGVDATSKMIAWGRVAMPDDGGTYYKFYKSANGGTTWVQDSAEDAGSFVNDNGGTVAGPFSRILNYTFLSSNSPVDIMEHNGMIYVINGERNLTNGYKLKFSTATPEEAYRNKFDDWARPTTVLTFHANTAGATIDCGYPVLFKDYQGKLWCQYYDISTLANSGPGDKRGLIKQVKIAD
jgi:hypothetical protein